MDQTRRKQLISKLKTLGIDKDGQPSPLVSLEDFFEGNDDIGSIGCNLLESPGPEGFYETLLEIRSLPTVQDVLVEVMEIEEVDETMWPFSERIYIFADSNTAEVEGWVNALEPDEVDEGYAYDVPSTAPQLKPNIKVFSVWWD